MSFKNRCCFTGLQAILMLFSGYAFALEAGDIVSPSSGSWDNPQPLVINIKDSSEVYYSLDGSDPLVSGMAYDEPFLIERTGSVKLTVTAVAPDGTRSDYYIDYSVKDADMSGAEAEEKSFVSSIEAAPIRRYVSGSSLDIPSSLRFSFDGKYWEEGRAISLNEGNALSRYARIALSDGKNSWSFVLNVAESPSRYAPSSRSAEDLPFYISDWNTLIYTSSYYIYQVDDEDWTSSRDSVILDRSVPHTVRWQSVEYSPDNAVEEFYLEKRPFISRTQDNGTITCFIDGGEDFELCYNGLKGNELVIDAFDAEDITGSIDVTVFYRGLEQGRQEIPYSIDRIPPAVPVISSSSSSTFARDKVVLNIKGDEDSTILYAVSDAYESEIGFQDITLPDFNDIKTGDFGIYDGKDITLRSSNDNACFYKVAAYAVDSAGNKSPETEYRVVVDEYNYYLYAGGIDVSSSYFASASSSKPDGSYTNPFTNLDQALKVINASDYTRLHVIGELDLTSGSRRIKKDCLIIGSSSRITMPSDTFIEISGADVSFEGFIFEKKDGEESGSTSHIMFSIDKGNVAFSDCELVGIFGRSGILCNASSSKVSFKDCGITVQTDDYGCIFSSINTDLVMDNCRAQTVSPNCVNLSIHGGNCTVRNSSCSIMGKIGRAIELVASKAWLDSNTFKANNGSAVSSYLSAIWTDDDSVIESNSNNTETGF